MADVYEQHGNALTASWSPGRAVVAVASHVVLVSTSMGRFGPFYTAKCSCGWRAEYNLEVWAQNARTKHLRSAE